MSSSLSPLVRKRNTGTALGKLIQHIQTELNTFLTNSDQSSRVTFFGGNNAPEKKKIIEQALTGLKKLIKNYKEISTDTLKTLGNILLEAKFQALALYIQSGERPTELNRSLDNCIRFFTKQVAKINNHQEIEQLFKSLLVIHQVNVLKQLYDQYHEKTLAMCLQNSENKVAREALNRFHEQLKDNNQLFLQGLTRYTLNVDSNNFPVFTKEQFVEINRFLNDQNRKIIELEPASEDLKITDVSNVYRWGLVAGSKVMDYLRVINQQLITNEEFLPALKA